MDRIITQAEKLAEHKNGYTTALCGDGKSYAEASETWNILKLAELELRVKRLEQLIENVESSLTTIKQLILKTNES